MSSQCPIINYLWIMNRNFQLSNCHSHHRTEPHFFHRLYSQSTDHQYWLWLASSQTAVEKEQVWSVCTANRLISSNLGAVGCGPPVGCGGWLVSADSSWILLQKSHVTLICTDFGPCPCQPCYCSLYGWLCGSSSAYQRLSLFQATLDSLTSLLNCWIESSEGWNAGVGDHHRFVD